MFCVAFRRPTMSCIEQLFVDMGKAGMSPKPISRRGLEEIYISLVLLPVLTMNLRASFDPEVTVTDASPIGGGAAVATMFKHDPDMVLHDGLHCYLCERDMPENASYPCPAGCRALPAIKLCGA